MFVNTWHIALKRVIVCGVLFGETELSHVLSLKEKNCLFFNDPRQYADLARLKAKLLFMHFKFTADSVL